MDAVAAVDAFFLVDHAQAVLVIGDGSRRAGTLAGPFGVDDRAEGAGLRAHSAGLAFIRVDLHLRVARGDRPEPARVEAGLAQAEPAAVRDHMVLDRAVVTGRRDDGNDIFCRFVYVRIHAHGQADPAADDLALFIDAAPVGRLRPGAHAVDKLLPLLVVQGAVPRHAADFPDYMVLEFNEAFIIRDHKQFLSAAGRVSAVIFCLYSIIIPALPHPEPAALHRAPPRAM